ncbi:MAG: hypothetical protein RL160_1963 [Bacteroidota bacterium]
MNLLKKVIKPILLLHLMGSALQAGAQCYPAFGKFTTPPALKIGYTPFYNNGSEGLFQVKSLPEYGTRGPEMRHIWNGSNWDTISVPLNTYTYSSDPVQVYNRKIYLGCKERVFRGAAASAGKCFALLRYDKGIWDTISGAMLDTGLFVNAEAKFVSNNQGIYLYLDFTFKDSALVFHYSDSTRKFTQIVRGKPTRSNFSSSTNRIYAAPNRILLAMRQINGQNTTGFGYIDSSGIHLVNDSNFNTKLDYRIDAKNGDIYAMERKDNPEIRIYTNKLLKRYKTKLDSKNQVTNNIHVRDGVIIWLRPESNASLIHYQILCPGESRWKIITETGTNEKLIRSNIHGIFLVDFRWPNATIYTLDNGAMLTGSVYIDNDSNCNKDSFDMPIKYRTISLKGKNGSYFALLDSNGQYETYLMPDSLEISDSRPLSSCAKTKIVISKTGTAYSFDMPVKKPVHHDLAVYNYNFTRLRWNDYPYFQFEVENLGMPADSAHFTIQIDPKLKIISKDKSIDSIRNNTAYGKLYNLGYYDLRKIGLRVWIDTATTKPDSIVCHKLEAFLYVPEKDSTNNRIGHCRKVVYSYDPNQKTVDKEILSPGQKPRLTYRIDFQNEGGDDAIDVRISDTLSHRLNPESIRILSASHPYTSAYLNRELSFTFRNIHLKPKKEDEILSRGYVIFSIETMNNMNIGDSITNKANIYFDLNKPVITADAVSRVPANQNNSAKSPARAMETRLYPNPATGQVNIIIPGYAGQVEAGFYTSDGKLLFRQSGNQGQIFNISQLSSGLYFVRVSQLANGNYSTLKLLVE